MFDVYNSSLLGIWLILATIVIQAMVAVRVHRRQSGGYSPGILKSELGHSSIVFRAHRTFHNSLENVIPILGMTISAMFAGYGALKLSIIVWILSLIHI